jgi:hypothetical protein
VRVEVDETTPVARVTVEQGSPLVLQAESGALEDSKRPRHLSEVAVITNLGRPLLRQRDRAGSGFGAAPADDDLTLAETATWDVYNVNRQRWLYNFRNRHGFTDGVDEAFRRLWDGDGLSWADLAALSEAARPGASTTV